MKRLRTTWSIWFLFAWIIAGAALHGAASAHADIICRTDYMSSTTYIYCHGTDTNGYPYNTVTTCYDGSSYCTTRNM